MFIIICLNAYGNFILYSTNVFKTREEAEEYAKFIPADYQPTIVGDWNWQLRFPARQYVVEDEDMEVNHD